MMNVFVLILVIVTVNVNDDDYNDNVKVMMIYDDDDHQYLLPYLLDEDQHPLANKEKTDFYFRENFFFKPDVKFDDYPHNLFVVVVVQTVMMVMVVDRISAEDVLDQMTLILTYY
jgi:hypothetical protein